jgi:tRNA(His) 5'-end guanylyltransferase
VDYQSEEASAWFDNNIQKMASVSASMATMAFNRFFSEEVDMFCYNNGENYEKDSPERVLCDIYRKARTKGAMFDSRVFTLPKEEVVNCLIWRQQDATRNSIQSVGQANFSDKELHGKKCDDIQDMLMLEKGINWNDFPTHLKRGSCGVKKPFKINEGTDQETVRNKWVVDTEIPIFTQNKDYVNRLIFV